MWFHLSLLIEQLKICQAGYSAFIEFDGGTSTTIAAFSLWQGKEVARKEKNNALAGRGIVTTFPVMSLQFGNENWRSRGLSLSEYSIFHAR